jgi:hypothetical protein
MNENEFEYKMLGYKNKQIQYFSPSCSNALFSMPWIPESAAGAVWVASALPSELW